MIESPAGAVNAALMPSLSGEKNIWIGGLALGLTPNEKGWLASLFSRRPRERVAVPRKTEALREDAGVAAPPRPRPSVSVAEPIKPSPRVSGAVRKSAAQQSLALGDNYVLPDVGLLAPVVDKGRLQIDRAALERHACGCYRVIRDHLPEVFRAGEVDGVSFLSTFLEAFETLFAQRGFVDAFIRVPGETRSNIKLAEQDGRITAVLDWELVHAGDPHEDLAWAALRGPEGGTAVLNAANEVAVEAFLDGRLRFTDIPVLIEKTLTQLPMMAADELAGITASWQEAAPGPGLWVAVDQEGGNVQTLSGPGFASSTCSACSRVPAKKSVTTSSSTTVARSVAGESCAGRRRCSPTSGSTCPTSAPPRSPATRSPPTAASSPATCPSSTTTCTTGWSTSPR